MNANDDDPRDAWLKEALRHAPDADAAPSPRLDAAVLRMGRAAVAPRTPRAAPPPPTWLDHLGAAWRWLAQPPVAAGFASVMVATVVGLMWWDRPMQDALPPRDAPMTAATEAQPPVAAASTPPMIVAQAPRSDVGEPPRQTAAPAKAPPALAKSTTPAPVTPAAPERQREAAAATDAIRSATAGAAAAPAAPSAALPAPESSRLGSLFERRGMVAAPKAEARRETEAAAPQAQSAPPVAAATAPLADAARAATPAASAEFIATPGLSNLRFEIRAKPQGWTWQRDGGEARPVDDAMQGWIAQADRTARPRWLAGGADGDATTTLRFLRDGQTRAVLRIGAKGLRIDRGGKVESVELSGGQVAALRSALDALGP